MVREHITKNELKLQKQAQSGTEQGSSKSTLETERLLE